MARVEVTGPGLRAGLTILLSVVSMAGCAHHHRPFIDQVRDDTGRECSETHPLAGPGLVEPGPDREYMRFMMMPSFEPFEIVWLERVRSSYFLVIEPSDNPLWHQPEPVTRPVYCALALAEWRAVKDLLVRSGFVAGVVPDQSEDDRRTMDGTGWRVEALMDGEHRTVELADPPGYGFGRRREKLLLSAAAMALDYAGY